MVYVGALIAVIGSFLGLYQQVSIPDKWPPFISEEQESPIIKISFLDGEPILFKTSSKYSFEGFWYPTFSETKYPSK